MTCAGVLEFAPHANEGGSERVRGLEGAGNTPRWER